MGAQDVDELIREELDEGIKAANSLELVISKEPEDDSIVLKEFDKIRAELVKSVKLAEVDIASVLLPARLKPDDVEMGLVLVSTELELADGIEEMDSALLPTTLELCAAEEEYKLLDIDPERELAIREDGGRDVVEKPSALLLRELNITSEIELDRTENDNGDE